ncbi:MAG TPA: GNAT family N-acetyltransferase [Rectinemataceae bacterium]|nr:GNAT family N-acetyltransferase [Rectinemataceae bacterium]
MQPLIDDVTLGDIDSCARIACESEIGRRYGFERAALAEKMRAGLASGAVIVVARESAGTPRAGGATRIAADRASATAAESRRPDPRGVLGFAWIDPRGAFGSAPYLKLIAVDTNKRSGGVGSALLAEFEKRTLAIGKVWTLMVSDFNLGAVAFYEKHGYCKAGAIPGFAVEGIAEILMVKKKT